MLPLPWAHMAEPGIEHTPSLLEPMTLQKFHVQFLRLQGLSTRLFHLEPNAGVLMACTC